MLNTFDYFKYIIQFKNATKESQKDQETVGGGEK
jgi:hypothetical protein